MELLEQQGVASEPVLWSRLSWRQLETRLRADDLALLPVGAIEQHGPHLSVDTDVAIAEALCGYASAVTGVLVLPTVAYASSMGHTDRWPGTLSLTPVTLITVVREIAGWFARCGGRRLLLVNAHYGNDAPLRCAVDHLRTDGTLQGVGLWNSWMLSPNARAFYEQDGVDVHANRAETALMLAIDPGSVGDVGEADDPDRTAGLVLSHPVAATSRNGVTGRPSEATVEEGRRMWAALGEDLARIVETARGEKPPLSAPERDEA
jgi:creatinine amidohydrolase